MNSSYCDFQYDDVVDAMLFSFTKPILGLIKYSRTIGPEVGIIVDLDKEDKIVDLEIQSASYLLSSTDYRFCKYDQQQDIFQVYFIDPKNSKIRRQETAMNGIEICYNADKQIVAFLFNNASINIYGKSFICK